MEDNIRTSIEIVIYLGEAARISHGALFPLADESYVEATENIVGAIMSAADQSPDRLHIAAGWKAIVAVALWTSEEPAMYAVMNLLRKSGLTDEDLGPFLKSDIDDLFPWLYYNRRFDILRRICRAAKAKAEANTGRKFSCHLVCDEEVKIVASSL